MGEIIFFVNGESRARIYGDAAKGEEWNAPNELRSSIASALRPRRA
jgi:hypothetical protein